MKKSKKNKKGITLACKLRNQADQKNQFDCESILESFNESSKTGEYMRTIQLKVNQAHYIKTLGLSVTAVSDKIGYYEISWKDEK
jgi:hypothetical protein